MRGVSGFHNGQRRNQQLPSGVFPIKESIEAPELHRGVGQGSRDGTDRTLPETLPMKKTGLVGND